MTLSALRFFRWGWAWALQHVVMGQSHPALRHAQPSGAEILGSYSRGVPSATALFSGLPLFLRWSMAREKAKENEDAMPRVRSLLQ
jgi:hypothetical protein